ncbi:hypothetical protein [Persephonella sp.]
MLYERLCEDFASCISRNINNPERVIRISCAENHKKVLFEIHPGETGLILIIDDKFSGRCSNEEIRCEEFRSHSKCDILLYYCNNNDNNLIKNVVFIELKGVNVGDAIEQIKHSIRYFKRKYNNSTFRYKVGAVLIHGGGAPQQKFKDPELKRLIDLNPFFTRTNQGNINEYIRSS